MPEESPTPSNDLRGKGKDKHLPQIDPDKNPALLARLNFNGAEQYRLKMQQRFAGKIHDVQQAVLQQQEFDGNMPTSLTLPIMPANFVTTIWHNTRSSRTSFS
jgi:hypothetical protein